MADAERLHLQALSVASELLEHLTTKPTAMLVAVLWHDIPMPLTDASRESFMFIKCTARTTVAKIREAFLAREEAPSDILLHLGSGFPSEATRVAELDHFRGKVIVFHARSVDLGVTTSNMTDGSTKDSTLNDMPDGTLSNTMYSPTDGTKSSSTHNGMSNGASSNTMNSSVNGIPDGMSNKSTYNRTYDMMDTHQIIARRRTCRTTQRAARRMIC